MLGKLSAFVDMQVITSCNSTQQELTDEFCVQTERQLSAAPLAVSKCTAAASGFEMVDYVRTYPTFKFGGVDGTKVCTVAFKKVNLSKCQLLL